jgi:UDP-N-acetylmuramoyl-tripeptide--D-alanyl-D-alanine ligase
MRLTLQEVAAATGGIAFGSGEVSGVSTDSRRVTAGDLFVAISGERFDGHDFCESAVSAGAAAVLAGLGRCTLEPRVEVRDPQRALLDLAVVRRRQLDVPVIAITGSTGKTSTKDMVAAAMGPEAWASPASYNNEIGVPLTVLGAPDAASALVVEVGSRGRGHIASLLPAIVPDVAVVTNLGLVHLETFGSVAALAEAKSELVAGLGSDGVAILPFGEDRLQFSGREVRFGTDAAADVRVSEPTLDADGRATFTLTTGDDEARLTLRMAGGHQPLNAAAAVGAAMAAGSSFAAATAGVCSATGSPWRMEVRRGRFVVVNDAYNANPTSMEAALRTTATLGTPHLAVLGVMAELGPVAEEEHRRIGALAAELGFDPVIVVGDAPGLVDGAAEAAVAVADGGAAFEVATRAASDGAAILVKGSRVAGLEVLAEKLAQEAGA